MRYTTSTMKYTAFTFIMLLMVVLVSCSHKFDPDVLNLDFYQWNLWQDTSANTDDLLPSCGWEDFKRGKGKLVRIPASLEEQFPEHELPAVFWYHCRFTLPDKWEELPISLFFESASPIINVFLNEEEVGSFQVEEGSFEVDVSEQIYYTRDNHLSIRISLMDGVGKREESGITGTILVKPELNKDRNQDLSD
jgi:beta-galactosidase/beta-glucuronidase